MSDFNSLAQQLVSILDEKSQVSVDGADFGGSQEDVEALKAQLQALSIDLAELDKHSSSFSNNILRTPSSPLYF